LKTQIKTKLQIYPFVSRYIHSVTYCTLKALLLSMEMANGKGAEIRPDVSRYPSCIVWTPIPLLT